MESPWWQLTASHSRSVGGHSRRSDQSVKQSDGASTNVRLVENSPHRPWLLAPRRHRPWPQSFPSEFKKLRGALLVKGGPQIWECGGMPPLFLRHRRIWTRMTRIFTEEKGIVSVSIREIRVSPSASEAKAPLVPAHSKASSATCIRCPSRTPLLARPYSPEGGTPNIPPSLRLRVSAVKSSSSAVYHRAKTTQTGVPTDSVWPVGVNRPVAGSTRKITMESESWLAAQRVRPEGSN